MKVRSKDRAVSKAWSGRWNDGSIGWNLPSYIDDDIGSEPITPRQEEMMKGLKGKFYRVRVTVELVRDSKGRPITRRGGSDEG